MPFSLEFQIGRFGLTPRNHANLMRMLNRLCMERHATERLPKHFEERAHSEYGARQRSEKYNKHKMKTYGHKKPNVATGHLQRSIRTSITATQYGAKLIIRAALNNRVPDEEWAQMTIEQKAAVQKKQRRLATWQKREIAIMSRKEIRQERARQARDYAKFAKTDEFRRFRKRKVK